MFHRNVNRVKSLSKSGNPRKDPIPNCVPQPQPNKDVSSTSTLLASDHAEDFSNQRLEKPLDLGRKPFEMENTMYSSAAIADKQIPSISSNHLSNGREEKGITSSISSNYLSNGREEKGASASMEERFEKKNSYNDSSSQTTHSYSQNDSDEKVQKVSSPRRKGSKDERSERPTNLMKRDINGSDPSTTSSKQQITGNHNTVTTRSRLYEAESASDANINAVLEVCKTWIISDLFFTSFPLNKKLVQVISTFAGGRSTNCFS